MEHFGLRKIFNSIVTKMVTIVYICKAMRVIAVKTLREYAKEFHQAEQALLSWYDEITNAEWDSTSELKGQYRNASILNNKRVVFNIHGNSYRLIVDIEYRLKIVFIVWFGTHKQYDNIDAKTISYDKAN
jgi:mRNA interferase HigB